MQKWCSNYIAGSQPDGFILNTHLDTVFPGLPGKNQKFGGAVPDAEVFSLLMPTALHQIINPSHYHLFIQLHGSQHRAELYPTSQAAVLFRSGPASGGYKHSYPPASHLRK